MSKEKFAETLNLIPHEAMQVLQDEADAERVVEITVMAPGNEEAYLNMLTNDCED